jgi:hypothetical protein
MELQHNFFTYAPKIIIQVIWDIVYFPLWWYSVGLVRLLIKINVFLKNRNAALGFSVWLKNIFTPMYGQRDIVSRLISFLVRLFQIFFRGLALIVWLVFCLAWLAIWLFLPLALVILLIYQFV